MVKLVTLFRKKSIGLVITDHILSFTFCLYFLFYLLLCIPMRCICMKVSHNRSTNIVYEKTPHGVTFNVFQGLKYRRPEYHYASNVHLQYTIKYYEKASWCNLQLNLCSRFYWHADFMLFTSQTSDAAVIIIIYIKAGRKQSVYGLTQVKSNAPNPAYTMCKILSRMMMQRRPKTIRTMRQTKSTP